MMQAFAYDRSIGFGWQWTAGRAMLASAFLSLAWLGCLTCGNAFADDQPQSAESPQLEVSADDADRDRDSDFHVEALTDREVPPETTFHRIGATAVVTEVTTGLPFPARVDTGATTCSIHCEKLVIEDPADDPADNVGKPVRILVKNNEGEEEWIESKIADHVVVRTSNDEDERYKVRLKLRWQEFEKKVLVTLNDREKMKYPLLLGRNFLAGDFVVDVDLDDKPSE